MSKVLTPEQHLVLTNFLLAIDEYERQEGCDDLLDLRTDFCADGNDFCLSFRDVSSLKTIIIHDEGLVAVSYINRHRAYEADFLRFYELKDGIPFGKIVAELLPL